MLTFPLEIAKEFQKLQNLRLKSFGKMGTLIILNKEKKTSDVDAESDQNVQL
jgi:hypothetical protein